MEIDRQLRAWRLFLEHRREYILLARASGTSWDEIVRDVNLEDEEHAKRIVEASEALRG